MSSVPLLQAAHGLDAPLKPVVTTSRTPTTWDRLSRYATLIWVFGPWLIGLAIGGLTPLPPGEPCSGLPPLVERLSTVIGWIYFAAWSVSFYPQVWLNFGRKSVVGLSLDFQVLNMIGFLAYAIYNSLLYWNPVVRQEYALEHGGAVPAVHANDVFFAIHAAALTAITLVQCCIHDRGGQRPSRICITATAAVVLLAAGYGGVVWVIGECVTDCRKGTWLALLSWLNWAYFLSYIKLAVSLVKYIPQVVLNYKRKSTQGWNIFNVLLDFEGGMLSLAQLLMDSGVTKDWSPVTGNPVKFGLGFTSMFFDIIFMAQHYILYRLPADPNTPPATYPTEGCCGYCGSLTCACIADLAHLVADGEEQEQQDGARAGAGGDADLELGSAEQEDNEQQPLLQQGGAGEEGGGVSASGAAGTAALPHSFNCSCCSGTSGSGSGSSR